MGISFDHAYIISKSRKATFEELQLRVVRIGNIKMDYHLVQRLVK